MTKNLSYSKKQLKSVIMNVLDNSIDNVLYKKLGKITSWIVVKLYSYIKVYRVSIDPCGPSRNSIYIQKLGLSTLTYYEYHAHQYSKLNWFAPGTKASRNIKSCAHSTSSMVQFNPIWFLKTLYNERDPYQVKQVPIRSTNNSITITYHSTYLSLDKIAYIQKLVDKETNHIYFVYRSNNNYLVCYADTLLWYNKASGTLSGAWLIAQDIAKNTSNSTEIKIMPMSTRRLITTQTGRNIEINDSKTYAHNSNYKETTIWTLDTTRIKLTQTRHTFDSNDSNVCANHKDSIYWTNNIDNEYAKWKSQHQINDHNTRVYLTT